jgi:hypothetical protein
VYWFHRFAPKRRELTGMWDSGLQRGGCDPEA